MTDIEQLIEQLTVNQKVKLVTGESLWRTHPVEAAGIPLLKVSDGPNGVRGDGGVSAASFPVGICMASTWNADLIRQVGEAIGDEAISKSVDVVLGPTINLHRTPLGGRNFECYAEDPWLSGALATAFTEGLQSKGVGACVKHFVCNDSEFERHTISVEVDERTLREVYLRPFELAIRRSHPWSIMASYNRINGVYACSHDELLNGVLKGEWGYDGLVMSDWFAAKETEPNANGGLDLEMPGPPVAWGDHLLTAVTQGEVSEACLDDKIRRLLRLLERTGKFQNPPDQPERAENRPLHRSITRQAAREGMVLLKNKGVLPLDAESLQSLAVIGPNIHEFRIMGGGSSALAPHYTSEPFAALTERLAGAEVSQAQGCLTHKYLPEPARTTLSPSPESNASGLLCRFYQDTEFEQPLGERVIARGTIMLGGMAGEGRPMAATLEGLMTPPETGVYTFGLMSTGRARLFINDSLVIDNWSDTKPGDAFFGQSSTEIRGSQSLTADEPASVRLEFAADTTKQFRAMRYGILPPQPTNSIAEAVELASSADAVLLMTGTNDDWETEGNDRESLSLPGEQDALVAAVSAVNPRTIVVNNSGSPISMPWLDRVGAVLQTWFPGQEYGNALCDILLGETNPSGKLPVTFPKRMEDTPAFTSYPGEFGKVRYGEGLFIGHRWYDARGIEPLFCFGHGLSYTTFEFEEMSVSREKSGEITVSVLVRNTGEREGMETVQIYVEPLSPSVSRPVRELRGFIKLSLVPGESATARTGLDPDCLAYWNPEKRCWTTEPGEYRIHAGSSSGVLPLSQDLTVAAAD